MLKELEKEKPVIIFDRTGEYVSGSDMPDCDYTTHRSTVDFYETIEQEMDGVIDGIHVIRCTKDQDYKLGLGFFKALQQPVIIALDEAHDLFLAKELAPAKEALTQITRYGGMHGIDLIFISQRTKDLPPDIRSQFTGVISFKQSFEGDVKALKSIDPEKAENVLDLDKREFEVLGDVPKQLIKK